jgi:hypothetical protein
MNITLSAFDVERYRRTNPGHRLDGLTNITFTVDASGNVVDCRGTTVGVPNQQLFAGPGLDGLGKIARARFEAARRMVPTGSANGGYSADQTQE